MIIDTIDIRHVKLDLASPFETSFGRFTERHPIIVAIESEGNTYFGEAPTLIGPYYSPETTESAMHVLEHYAAPATIGQDITTPKQLHDKLDFIKGNFIAKSGLDTAVHVMLAQQQNQSLSEYLGGTRDNIDVGISIGIQRDDRGNISIDRLIEKVQGHVDEGYKRIKIKIKPGFDIEPVRAIRSAFGEDLGLQVDANSAYSLKDLQTLKKLDDYGLLLIEQPLASDDIIDHAKLQANMYTPICLDESIETLDDARHAVELESAKVINIKLARVGGLYHAKKIHDYCQEQNIPVWCGGMVESAIGQSHAIALASLTNFVLPADIAPSERYFKEDFIHPFISLNNGQVEVSKTPGLGYEVNRDFLDQATIDRRVIYESK